MASSSSSLTEQTASSLSRLEVNPDSSLLVAVSGGIDSMSMLHVLVSLRDAHKVRSLHAVHVNHQLRGEASESDERLVRKSCEMLRVPLEVFRVDTAARARERKCGLEEAARYARYIAFSETARKIDANYIVTAHTADDQAETVLMNMVRGAGLRGLAGIPAKRSVEGAILVRPWLDVRREEIEQYATEKGIAYSEDATNAELVFQRNRVRHMVIPALQQAFPDRDVLAAIVSLTERMSSLTEFVTNFAEGALRRVKHAQGLDVTGLRELPHELAGEVLELWLNEEVGRYRLSSDERERLHSFIRQDQGRLQLRAVALRLSRERLSIERVSETYPETPLAFGELRLPHGTLCVRSADEIVLDERHLYVHSEDIPTLVIRPWRDRDRMSPYGMSGQTKLVSDLLTDAGITGSSRKNYPVLESSSGEILWIPGVRGSEQTRMLRATGGVEGQSSLAELEWVPKHAD